MLALLSHLPIWLRLLLLLLLVYLIIAISISALANRIIFLPPSPSYPHDLENLHHLKTSADESIAAFYLPAQPDFPTLLYSHGNAEDLGHSQSFYHACHQAGFGILAYDYPGYGQSTGTPSESSAQRAILTAWEFLTGEHQLDPDDIIVVGRSVGSGPSVWLDTQTSPRALILISPFTSTYAVQPPAQHLFFGNRFPNLKRLRKSTTPLLIIHAENDRIIPPEHGRSLHRASPAITKKFIALPDAGHNDLYAIHQPQIIHAIREFGLPLTD